MFNHRLLYNFIAIIIISNCESTLTVPTENPLATYFSQHVEHLPDPKKLDVLSMLGALGDVNCKDILDAILMHTINYTYFINDMKTNQLGNTTIIENTAILFALDENDIDNIMHKAMANSFFECKLEIFFIICSPVKSTDWLENALNSIWKNRILNFILIFYHQSVQKWTLNPFLEKAPERMINLSDAVSFDELFPNKLLNLHGYTLRISLFFDIQRMVRDENDTMLGEDVELLKIMMERINASYEIIAPNYTIVEQYAAARDDMLKNKSDFIGNIMFVRPGQDSGFENIQYTYPNIRNDIVILVPKATTVPQYFKMFFTFDVYVWTGIIVTLFTMSIFIALVEDFKNPKFIETFLNVFRTFLWSPMHHISRKTWAVRFWLTFWMILSIILTSAFETSLTSTLVTTKYDKEINRLHHLEASKLPLLITNFSASIYAENGSLTKQFIISDRQEINANLFSRNTEQAYAVTLAASKNLIRLTRNLENGEDTYHQMTEAIIPGFAGYTFPKHSPYYNRINQLVQNIEATAQKRRYWDFRYGDDVNRNYSQSHVLHRNRAPQPPQLFTIRHLQTSFYIFVIGITFSLVVFFAEIYCYKYNSARIQIGVGNLYEMTNLH